MKHVYISSKQHKRPEFESVDKGIFSLIFVFLFPCTDQDSDLPLKVLSLVSFPVVFQVRGFVFSVSILPHTLS